MAETNEAVWDHVSGKWADAEARGDRGPDHGHAAADEGNAVGPSRGFQCLEYAGASDARLRMHGERQDRFGTRVRGCWTGAPNQGFDAHDDAALAAGKSLRKHEVVPTLVEFAEQVTAHAGGDHQFDVRIALHEACQCRRQAS